MLLEGVIIGLCIGFVFGYFSYNWDWSKKIAEILDRFIKKKDSDK